LIYDQADEGVRVNLPTVRRGVRTRLLKWLTNGVQGHGCGGHAIDHYFFKFFVSFMAGLKPAVMR
jgi:hypothetical protein